MKKAYWAGAALILAFLVLGLTTFSSTMTPYVTFDEAEHSVRVVQDDVVRADVVVADHRTRRPREPSPTPHPILGGE